MEAAQVPDAGQGTATGDRLRLILSGETDDEPPEFFDASRLRDAAQHEAALEEEQLRLAGEQYRRHALLAESARDLMVPPDQYTYRDSETKRLFSVVADSKGDLHAVQFKEPEVVEEREGSKVLRYERYVWHMVTLAPETPATRSDELPVSRPRNHSVWKRADMIAEVDNEYHVTKHSEYEPPREADPERVEELQKMLDRVSATRLRSRAV